MFNRNRFEFIKRFANFNNTKDKKMTLTETGYIQLDLCLKHTDKIVSQITKEYNSIDEQIIPFK